MEPSWLSPSIAVIIGTLIGGAATFGATLVTSSNASRVERRKTAREDAQIDRIRADDAASHDAERGNTVIDWFVVAASKVNVMAESATEDEFDDRFDGYWRSNEAALQVEVLRISDDETRTALLDVMTAIRESRGLVYDYLIVKSTLDHIQNMLDLGMQIGAACHHRKSLGQDIRERLNQVRANHEGLVQVQHHIRASELAYLQAQQREDSE